MAGAIGAIIGGLLMGGAAGIGQANAERQRRSEDFQRKVMGEAILKAVELGQFGPEHQDALRDLFPNRKSADIAFQALMAASQGNRALIQKEQAMMEGAMGGAVPGAGAPAQASPGAPLNAFFPGTQGGMAAPQAPRVGMPAPGQSVEALPPVPTQPSQGMTADEMYRSKITSGRAMSPVSEGYPGAYTTETLHEALPAPTQAPRAAPVPAPPVAPAPPEAPATTGVRPEVVQQLVGSVGGMGGALPEGASIHLKSAPRGLVQYTITGKDQAANRGTALLRNAGTATVAEVLEAAVQSKATLPDTYKAWAEGRIEQTYQQFRMQAQRLGARGQEADRWAAQQTVRTQGAPGNLPKELLYADKASEDADFRTFILERAASGVRPLEAMEQAFTLGFRPSEEAVKASKAFIYQMVRDRALQRLRTQGIPLQEAMPKAIQVAVEASGHFPDNAQESKLGFPELPALPSVEPVLREHGLTAQTATGKQVREAGEVTRGRELEQEAAKAGVTTRQRLLQERGAGGVPERAPAAAVEAAGQRGVEYQIAQEILMTTDKHPDWFGGPYGMQGRVKRWQENVNMAPAGFSEFRNNVELLRSAIVRRLAGANIGPAEAQTYLNAIPELGQSSQKFKANVRATLKNLERLDAITARIQGEQATIPTPAIPGAPPAGTAPNDPLGILTPRRK